MKRIALCVVLACGGAPATTTPTPSRPGVVTEGMDPSVRPGDDFFAYANDGWLKAHDIPPDRSSYGSGTVVGELVEQRTAELIQQAAATATPRSEAQQIGDLYASYMDEAGIEAKGIEPLQADLAAIAKIDDEHGLARAFGAMLRTDVDALNSTNFETRNLFGLWIAQDLDDPSRYSPFLFQGGLGMGVRDYYLDDAPRMQTIRDKYRAHVAALLELAKIPDAASKADRVVALEKLIATAHVSRVDSEDVHKADNHWASADFSKLAPGLDWRAFFDAAGLAEQRTFIVWQPSAITKIAEIVHLHPVAEWRDYLTFHAIDRIANQLPKAFVDETFAFWGPVMSGVEKQRERSKRGINLTSRVLGEAVGKLYVARYFPPSEKARAETMVKNLVAAFALRIDKLDWMTPATKAKAKAKLATLKVGVGYPDHWRDYAGLEIVRGDIVGNLRRASLFDYHQDLAKLGKPIDRGEWVMTPQTIDAVNLPVMNALNFPAGILQPPYFDPNRPVAMDYGDTGATIGHEISHSFDDTGAEFDASGKLANWWTPADHEHFAASSKLLVDQYDAYKPFSDLAVNGKQTLGENIADAAGLAVAYDAYRISLGGHEAPVVDGLTGDQQFFIAYAKSWREKAREALQRQQIIRDGHAPGKYRTWTVRNIDAWYPAFKVEPGQALYVPADKRAHIW